MIGSDPDLSILKHDGQIDTALDAYVKARRLALGKAIAGRHKVYLDTKYWVLLRDEKLGRLVDRDVSKLAVLLHRGVQPEQLICPISADILSEILKQTDPATLACAVEVIDALSNGISLLAPEERRRMELLYFLRKNLPGNSDCYSPDIFVWTKLAYVFGFITPSNALLSAKEGITIQKAFFDHMWGMSLAEIISTIGIQAIRKMPRMPDVSAKLNTGKVAHMDENRSMDAMIQSEIAGVLDAIKPDIQEMLEYLYKSLAENISTEEEILSSKGLHQFANLIYHGFRLKRFSTELPCVRIPATIHAAIRWDKTRKYWSTDPHDLHHAEAALPYFDMFLTERSLRSLLTRSDLRLDSLYNCTVVSHPNNAVTEIEKMIA